MEAGHQVSSVGPLLRLLILLLQGWWISAAIQDPPPADVRSTELARGQMSDCCCFLVMGMGQ